MTVEDWSRWHVAAQLVAATLQGVNLTRGVVTGGDGQSMALNARANVAYELWEEFERRLREEERRRNVVQLAAQPLGVPTPGVQPEFRDVWAERMRENVIPRKDS